MQRREILELNGILYTRFLDSPRRSLRVYFHAPRGSGKTVYHRDLWESVYGPIPPGYLIHHKDHNPLNNALENLVCLSPAQHAKQHPEVAGMPAARLEAIRPLASAWHRSEAGRAWHKDHGQRSWDQRQSVMDTCDHCGKLYATFFVTRSRPHFCSRQCSRAVADAEHRYEQQVSCPVCGTLFWQSTSKHEPETCSRHCGKVLFWRRRRGV